MSRILDLGIARWMSLVVRTLARRSADARRPLSQLSAPERHEDAPGCEYFVWRSRWEPTGAGSIPPVNLPYGVVRDLRRAEEITRPPWEYVLDVQVPLSSVHIDWSVQYFRYVRPSRLDTLSGVYDYGAEWDGLGFRTEGVQVRRINLKKWFAPERYFDSSMSLAPDALLMFMREAVREMRDRVVDDGNVFCSHGEPMAVVLSGNMMEFRARIVKRIDGVTVQKGPCSE